MIDHAKRKRALWLVLGGLVPVGVAAAAVAALPSPLVLYNPSPSIPKGYYLRDNRTPAKGEIIAFHVPVGGQEYARAWLDYLIRGSVIKPIVATAGDMVCTTGKSVKAGLWINGARLGPIVERDKFGRLLPHWNGCRKLSEGEFFVFSDRIPNSYDSRYYGPVRATDIIGTFRPLWVEAGDGSKGVG